MPLYVHSPVWCLLLEGRLSQSTVKLTAFCFFDDGASYFRRTIQFSVQDVKPKPLRGYGVLIPPLLVYQPLKTLAGIVAYTAVHRQRWWQQSVHRPRALGNPQSHRVEFRSGHLSRSSCLLDFSVLRAQLENRAPLVSEDLQKGIRSQSAGLVHIWPRDRRSSSSSAGVVAERTHVSA